MFSSAKADITTDGSGDATVYLTHGLNRKPNGFLVALSYVPGTMSSANLTITGETSGIPILTVTGAGTSNAFYYPRALFNEVLDASESVTGTEMIPIEDERIKVVVASGGATKSGSIKAILMNNPPY